MRKEERRRSWPYVEFNRFLDERMKRAGIPLTAKGTPNTVVFGEMTGINPGRVHYWRTGDNQPTVESLRQVAEGLAPHTGDDPVELLHELEVAAGRRSEAELTASRARAGFVASKADSLDMRIHLLEVRLAQDPPDEERRDLQIALVRAKRQRALEIEFIDEVIERWSIGDRHPTE